MLIRDVTIKDKAELLEWRNHPETRTMFIDQDLVQQDAHDHWFQKIMTSESHILFIGQRERNKIGVVRFDVNSEENTAEVSVNVNPTYRGQRLSKHLLGAAILEFLNKRSATLIAHVKKIHVNMVQTAAFNRLS